MNQVRIYRFELFIFILSLWIVSECFPNFKTRIPNGDKIPNPCVPGQIWHAIGHWHPVRGVERNQFGLDFKTAGLIYTVAFHYQDSDGDGITNGAELNVNLTSNQFYMEGNPKSHPDQQLQYKKNTTLTNRPTAFTIKKNTTLTKDQQLLQYKKHNTNKQTNSCYSTKNTTLTNKQTNSCYSTKNTTLTNRPTAVTIQKHNKYKNTTLTNRPTAVTVQKHNTNKQTNSCYSTKNTTLTETAVTIQKHNTNKQTNSCYNTKNTTLTNRPTAVTVQKTQH
ncbi:unnamed protein product [Mytilus edulis]|uniref:Temptin Cys/Cys disulfide domain-containing protein n=1 Tax=Mytilus edulis TaxID=6550 RepID=A0A8S3RDF7_MYTED|nr:unnamed protein product [Mytilus edulis]